MALRCNLLFDQLFEQFILAVLRGNHFPHQKTKLTQRRLLIHRLRLGVGRPYVNLGKKLGLLVLVHFFVLS